MNGSYYDALLPARDLSDDRRAVVAGLRLPYRAHASVFIPGGKIVVAFVSDSALLSNMFAANWAPAGLRQKPDATLYALAQPAGRYGLDGSWDEARWWSRAGKMMVVFGFGSYRLAKVCIRGMCSAASRDDVLFLHGCALSVGTGAGRRGVVITGRSGAGKTTLVAKLLVHAGYSVNVMNDDWGAVSLSSGNSVSTGERRLHMKSGSVLAIRPGFFTSAPRGSYSYDLSEPDRTVRLLVAPESVYGARWHPEATVIEHLAVIVREAPGWVPPGQEGKAPGSLNTAGCLDYFQHNEALLNRSLILTATGDELRETQRYQRLLDLAAVSWINNCGTTEELAENFISAVIR